MKDVHRHQRGKRDHVAVRVTDVELPDILCLRPEIAFGLHIDLPDTPEPIKEIHHDAAHERLQRLVDIGKIYALLQDFLTIHPRKDLRHGGNKRRIDSRNLWTFPKYLHEFLRVGGEEFDISARSIL